MSCAVGSVALEEPKRSGAGLSFELRRPQCGGARRRSDTLLSANAAPPPALRCLKRHAIVKAGHSVLTSGARPRRRSTRRMGRLRMRPIAAHTALLFVVGPLVAALACSPKTQEMTTGDDRWRRVPARDVRSAMSRRGAELSVGARAERPLHDGRVPRRGVTPCPCPNGRSSIGSRDDSPRALHRCSPRAARVRRWWINVDRDHRRAE